MKILFEIVTEQSGVAAGINDLKKRIKDLNKEIKNEGGKNTPDQLQTYTRELVTAKNEVSALTEKQRALNREFKQTRFPKDSIVGARLEISKLTDQYNALTRAARESAKGQQLAARISGLQSNVNKSNAAIGKTGLGDSISNAVSGSITRAGVIAGGIGLAVEATTSILRVGIKAANDYEQAIDNLSALTGSTGAELEKLKGVARGLEEINVQGVELVNTGTEVADALRLVGGARPELLGNAEALGFVTKQAIILSAASGDGLLPSVDALTTTLGQFNLEGTESARVINELAAGAKVGSSEIPQTTDALKAFGTVANTVNVTTGESIALIQTLADRQLKGAEAGTQLRNILSKLASADILPPKAQDQFRKLGIDINILKDTTLPFETRLKELGKAQGDVAALTKIFGLENLTAANIITSNIDKYDKFKSGIEGTNEALTQAAIRSDNANTSLQNLQNKAINNLEQGFSAFSPVINTVADGLSYVLDNVDLLTVSFAQLTGGATIVKKVFDLLGLSAKEMRKDVAPVQDSIDAVFGVGGDPLLGNIKNRYKDNLDQAVELFKIRGEQGGDGESAGTTIDSLKGRIKDLKKELGGVAAGTEQFFNLKSEIKEAQTELDKLIGRKGSAGKDTGAKGSLASFREAVNEARQALEKSPQFNIGGAIDQLKKAEVELKLLENRVDVIGSGRAVNVRGAIINRDAINGGTDGAAPELDAAENGPGLSDAQLEASIENNALLIDNTEFTAEQIFELEKALSDKKIGLTEEEAKERLKIEEEAEKKRAELRKLAIDQTLDSAGAVADAILQIDKNRLEKENDEKLSALEENYKNQIEAAAGNADLQAALEAELDQKRKDIEKQAANERKELARKEAIINIALAIVKALTAGFPQGLILAGAAAVAGGAQLSIIENTQFARGGYTGKGYDYRDSTGKRVAGIVHENEYVASEDQVKRYPSLFSELERDRLANLRPFAAGGFTSTVVPNFPTSTATTSSGFQQDTQGFTDAQVKSLGVNLGSIIGDIVGFEVRKQLAAGINDNNRLQERTNSLEKSRRV